MSESFQTLNFLPKGRFRVDLVPGVTKTNFLSICYGALTTIGLLTFIATATNYVLIENFGYIEEFDAAGRRVGSLGKQIAFLHAVAELVLLLVFLPVGLIADKIGRRPVYTLGMLTMGLSYFLYPLATGITELTIYRVIYAVGMGAATGMLGTVTADYPQNHTRGKMIAITGMLNALGIIFINRVFGYFPSWFSSMGYDEAHSGQYAMWVVAGMCVITAIVVAFGLQKGTPTEEQKKIPYLQQIKSGMAEGKNPRILLVYACAFVARPDLVILGSFLTAWATLTGVTSEGYLISVAVQKSIVVFITVSTTALIATPFLGYIVDKVDRIKAIPWYMAIAALGYLSMFLVETDFYLEVMRSITGNQELVISILSKEAIPLLILLGIGQQCAFVSATTLLGQEAPKIKRGAIVGVFNLAGALGILICVLISGWMFDNIHPSAPFVFMGFCNFSVSLIALYIKRIAPSNSQTQQQ